MKLFIAFLFSGLLAVSANTYSQQTKLSMDVDQITVKEVFDLIEKNSEFVFFYNENLIDVESKVSIKAEEEPIEKVLDKVFKGTTNQYKIYDRQVVIFKESKEKSPILNDTQNNTEQKEKKNIKGSVKDKDGEPLPGVSVIVKGSTIGTITDADGNFSFDIEIDSEILSFSFVGMKTKEVAIKDQTVFNIILESDNVGVDEVIVTGVFDPRSRMEASVAISTMTSKDIEKITINSACDLLKNVPGVYVNTSLGEIRNTVYSRGVSVGSNDGASGYYYVSMQEDGLPVTNATFNNFGPDYYLRADATLDRLDAVRGGTASILGNNAPGGIFNYISKTGGEKVAGEVRAKYGLEGNGINPYYRADFNVGGPLTKDKSIRFNIGGFYRKSDGARYPGYPMNNGGQVKANLVKLYKRGNLKLYAKYLDDKNAWYEFLPTIGFNNPHLPDGVSQTNSVLIPSIQSKFEINQSGEYVTYDSRDKIHSVDKSIGLNWEHHFDNGLKIDNKFRYSSKKSIWNTTAVAYPFAADNFLFYAIMGTLGNFGTYNFNDLASGNSIGSITQAPIMDNGEFVWFDFIVNQSNFPGASIQPNSLFFNPIAFWDNRVNELTDQFIVTKKLDDMSFTGGMFYSKSVVDRKASTGTGITFTQMTSPSPKFTDISIEGFDGKTYQVTNPDGIVAGGNGVSAPVDLIDADQSQLAFFLGHSWEINSQLNFDWGLRYEMIEINGTNQIAEPVQDTDGGLDGDPLTLYDNAHGEIQATYAYSNQQVNTLSFSTGINYKFDDNQAVYGRLSLGNKAPDMDMFILVEDQFALDNLNPIAQKIKQIEIGYKLNADNLNLFITPFMSILDNVPQMTQGQETDDISTTYITPILYNKYSTKGIEIEGVYDFTNELSLRAVATLQTAKADKFQTWLLNANGKLDDEIIDLSGNRTDNSANTIFKLTPKYENDKFFVSADFSYMGKRAANVANVFYLPAYNQTNLNVGYNITSKWQAQLNINNVFNQNGIMGWSAPGGFPAALDRQGFTKKMMEDNPDAVYSTLSLPPRAYFVTMSYRF